jgi:hypothetical protein
MSLNLTNEEISQTFQRLVQYDSGSYYDGLGNFIALSSFVQSSSYAITASIADRLSNTSILPISSASISYQQNLYINSSSYQIIVSVLTASYKAAFFDYVVFSGSISRAGTLYSVWSGSTTEWYEQYTSDIGGSTSNVILRSAISGSNIQLQASSSTDAWTIRSLIRLL